MSIYEAVNAIPATHHDLTHQYGCPAGHTFVAFIAHGIVHHARRLLRRDFPETGRIEIYTVEPWPGIEGTQLTELAWYGTAMTEDFLRYVDEESPCRVDRLAMILIDGVGSTLTRDQEARYAAVEF